MRLSILVGLVTTFSVVSCKDHSSHPDNTSQGRYKDRKNKRGIGDYSGVPYGGHSYQGFQTSPSSGISFTQGFPSFPGYAPFGSYGNINPLSHSPLNLSPQTSPGFSTIGAHNIGQSLNLGQNSGYNFQSPGLNFANLLGSSISSQNPYLSPNMGVYSHMEKTGPITFNSQGTVATQAQQQYTPIYPTGSQVGSSSYSIPVVLGSSQVSNLQGYRTSPSTLSSLSSQGLSIGSSPVNNGGSYSASYAPLTGDSSSHIVTGGYSMAASTPHQNTLLSSYSIPISTLTPAPSSSEYTMTISASPYNSAFNNPAYSNSLSASSYQLPLAAAAYANTPSSSSGDYTKYTSASSDDSIYTTSNQMRLGAAIKLESLSSPGMPSSSTNSGYSNSGNTNYAVSPNYSSNTLRSIPSKQSSYLLTSYGTPAMSYSIPSTSYGIPSHSQSLTTTNYNTKNSNQAYPSISFTSSNGPNYSNSENTHTMPSQSSSYQTESPYKTAARAILSVSSSRPSTSYESSTSSSSNDANSILNYKSSSSRPTSSLSNSIENYSLQSTSNSYDSGTDSSSSYSIPSTRYHRYPPNRSMPYIDSGEATGYDTISYSVPNAKY
ncbi:PREDICTED: mucin-12-like [Ceratosolen solmsi marchali]|uniref:Mucin-12-like n=1 Tax=Ceratosolen solmsi marchali TaxID=326594 RepID=A0AAJ6VK83_9HYME|nr:PREDICTED: mucin-12-like [Ceratosolen solmsi marchali]